MISSFAILIGLGILISNCLHGYQEQKIDNEYIKDFFVEDSKDVYLESDGEVIKAKTKNTHYIAVLEIPTISLKRGLVNQTSKDNNVDRNIEILTPSDMPNVSNSNLILAGHSGSGWNAFFKNLNKVSLDDTINLYFENNKYIYKVNNIYTENKDGTVAINNSDKTTLVLTTCVPNNKKLQLVVIAELLEINLIGGIN